MTKKKWWGRSISSREIRKNEIFSRGYRGFPPMSENECGIHFRMGVGVGDIELYVVGAISTMYVPPLPLPSPSLYSKKNN